MGTTDELLYFNGVNGDSGVYDVPPLTGAELAGLISGTAPEENINELKFRYQASTTRHFGVKEGVDPKNLAESGWGVIFPAKGDPAVQEALSALLDLRRAQAGEHFRLYAGPDGYRPDESKAKFLARHGAGPGPADPDKVPYYLLIVADPETIPYRFQSQLDVQYAVGRIYFETLDEYAQYARSVVAAESGAVALPRQMSFFGVANPEDRATQLSADQLVTPLFNDLQATFQPQGWQFDAVMREQATKSRLAQLLGGAATPALLFSASHGMAFGADSNRQLPHQGALLCQDWPGPSAWAGKPIPQDFYFAGDDLAADASLAGLVAFFFACYGAGTPRLDEFARQAFRDRTEIAPHAFLAQLPLKMLSHPRGGALAVVGHVERAWGYSFVWPGAGQQTTVFESSMHRLLDGHPVGSALEYFDERYAELSTVLADELEEIDFGKQVDPYELSGMWTANNDARGYTILGDPAVRLPLAKDDAAVVDRPVIQLQPVSTTPVVSSGPTPFSAPTDAPATAGDVVTVTTEAAGLRIVTVVGLSGDTTTRVEGGELTDAVVALHDAALRQALAARLASH